MNGLTKISFLLIVLCLGACTQDTTYIKDNPCINFPCDETYYNWSVKGQRFHSVPEFRKGMWVNIWQGVSHAPDTIIFHNDSIWSYFNIHGGYFEEKYTFDGFNLVLLTDHHGNKLDEPKKRFIYYDDTTGIMSMYRGSFHPVYDHYIKIE